MAGHPKEMVIFMVLFWVVPPSQDASHHQDYDIFLIGNPNRSTFISAITGRGDNPSFIHGRPSMIFTLVLSQCTNRPLEWLPSWNDGSTAWHDGKPSKVGYDTRSISFKLLYMCQGRSTPYIGDGHPTFNRESL